MIYNPDQADSDGDGIGDACDDNGDTNPVEFVEDAADDIAQNDTRLLDYSLSPTDVPCTPDSGCGCRMTRQVESPLNWLVVMFVAFFVIVRRTHRDRPSC